MPASRIKRGFVRVFDLEAGPVTVMRPDAGGRFMSMIAIDEEVAEIVIRLLLSRDHLRRFGCGADGAESDDEADVHRSRKRRTRVDVVGGVERFGWQS